MAEDIEFVNGLVVKAPRENAPEFVKCAISIKPRDLATWLADRLDQDWVNIDVKESRGGKWYAAVNAYKPKEGAAKPEPRKPAEDRYKGIDDDLDSDLPF